MKSRNLALIATSSILVLLGTAAIATDKTVSSKIELKVKEKLPSASGIDASMPLFDLPGNLTSDSIKAVNIKIDEYKPSGSNTKASLEIDAREIKKSGPTQVGSLDITSTISAATLIEQSNFEGTEIVDNTLQISVGAGGLGKAQLVPTFANNQIYFQLQSISIMGTPIPTDSLPSDIQDQIKSKSIREINIPKGMKLKSVSLSSKGLSVNLRGSNIQFGKLGTSL
jgi:hypothetical protein